MGRTLLHKEVARLKAAVAWRAAARPERDARPATDPAALAVTLTALCNAGVFDCLPGYREAHAELARLQRAAARGEITLDDPRLAAVEDCLLNILAAARRDTLNGAGNEDEEGE